MRTKFSGFLTLLLALVVQISFAQQKTITGTITDDTGMPLPGANIIIKGTQTGTQSDFDGNFSISASVGQTLVFSYVGFETQEVTVGAANTIDLTLSPGTALEQVVLRGYSRQNQTVSTSAVVSISAEELSQMAPTTSIDNMLQGKAAGVQVTAANGKPGQAAFVRIRGTGSLSAGASSPLYIVDGTPLREEELSNLSVDEMANVEILKDAAMTARYGSRGANGVVIITTKSGARNKDATIRFSSRYGTVSRIKPNYRMMNLEEKLRFEREMYAMGVTTAATLPGVTIQPGTPEYENMVKNEVDWQDLMLKDGIVQNNNFSISGGGERADYFFSLSHDRNTGIIDKIDGFERISSRLNINMDPKEWLNFGVNVGYSRATSDEPRDRNNDQNPFRAMLNYNPYETEYLMDENGDYVLDENGERVFNSRIHGGFNVRGALETEPSMLITNLLLASTDALVKFNKNWTYGFSTSFKYGFDRTENFSHPGGILDAILNPGNPLGYKVDQNVQRFDMTLSNRLMYNLHTESGHNFNALALYEYNFNEYNRIRLTSEGYANNILNTAENASTIVHIATDGETKISTTNRNRLALLSYGLFTEYDYKERYLFTASIRRDGSSNFGDDHKFGTFWSVSAGWNIAKENFFNVDEINDLKLRASYGTVGNRLGIGRYEALGTVGYGTYGGQSSIDIVRIANPDLKWETTHTLDVGLEVNLFNRRLRAVADYFERTTKDLLFAIPRAAESGISFVRGNLGTIQTNGFEFSLSGEVINTPDWKWTLGGNIYLQTKSEIVELPGGEDISAPFTYNILFREGSKINEHYMIRYVGVDPQTGRAQYLNANDEVVFANELTADDRVLQGKSSIADKEGGFFTDINYKGFGLRADFSFKAGNWINNVMKADRYLDPEYSTSIQDNMAVGAFNYWKQPGDNAELPSPIYRTDDALPATSDRWLEKGDYIRMRNITLSYTFPNRTLERTPINSLRIYLQGQNLLTFSNFWGDPEVGLSSGENISFAQAVAPGEATLYSYPNSKSFQVGLDISF